MKWDSYFTSYKEINLKWVNNLNIRAKIIKVLEQNIEANLCLGFGDGLFNLTLKAWAIKEKKDE